MLDFKVNDVLSVKPGKENFVSNLCRNRDDHRVAYIPKGANSWFVCNLDYDHTAANWLVVDTDIKTDSKESRCIGDWSSVPAERLTDPSTGASKGMRITRQDLIPPEALAEIGAVYGFGERKYPAGPDGPNWLRGMPFSWNLRALKDHISEWELGKDYDDEDGVSPLAHAVWHLMALLTYQARGLGTDDRPFKR